MIRRWRLRRAARNRAPWESEELARMTTEQKAHRKRRTKLREKRRRLLRNLPW